MYIMYMHMAMAVTMRVAFNIVLRFYRTVAADVKPCAKETPSEYDLPKVRWVPETTACK